MIGKLAKSGWAKLALLHPVRLTSAIIAETTDQKDRWFLWYPVFLVAGIGAYFALPREPHLSVFVFALFVLVALIWFAIYRRASFRLLMIIFFLSGFLVAKARVESINVAPLVATTPTLMVTGTVESFQKYGKKRARIYLRLSKVTELKPTAMPGLVRLSGRVPKTTIAYGDVITLKARLFPLPGPVEPDGFDFGRHLWFQGVGATGFFYGKVEKVSGLPDTQYSFTGWLQNLRRVIGERIVEALPDQSGAIAMALITGDRGKIDKTISKNLRKAGLAHILAISGLHMSLVAGGMFWLVRALLAFSGPLVLHYPVKKWAAIAGLAAGAGYLLMSGASIATQRAFVMLSIMLLAILLDRPAVSMRNVALAAMLIAIFRPESVVSASFQMSFMAVVGLVGFYEMLNIWRAGRTRSWFQSRPGLRFAGKVFTGLIAIAMTTIVASAFTGLPAAYHFNKFSTLSLAGNIIALPIVSLAVMPGAIVAMLGMPLGLENVGLTIMGNAIDLVLSHAEYIASFPHAQIAIANLQTGGVISVVFGLLWLSLWRGNLKFAAAIPVFTGIMFLQNAQPPDILIGKFGRNVAIRGDDGLYVPVDDRKSRFSTEKWLVSAGDMATLKQAAARSGWKCEGKICRSEVSGRKIVFVKRDGKATQQICKNLDIIISAEPLWDKCKSVSVRIDRFDLWKQGAHAIYLNKTKARVVTVQKQRGKRPWVIVPKARKTILIDPKKHKWKPKKPRKPLIKQKAA